MLEGQPSTCSRSQLRLHSHSRVSDAPICASAATRPLLQRRVFVWDSPYIDGADMVAGSYFFFISFVVLASFLLLNIFVAVIIDNIETMADKEGAPACVKHCDGFSDD